MSVGIALCLVTGLQQASTAQQAAPGRAPDDRGLLPRPDGRRARRSRPTAAGSSFSVGTRIEQDNSTRNEVQSCRPMRRAPPRRVLHYGKDITEPSWTDDGRLQYTADRQKWSVDPANARTAPVRLRRHCRPAQSSAPTASGWRFARTRRSRRKTRPTPASSRSATKSASRACTFDWKDFQRDGQPFPAPNLRARPAAQLVIQPADRRSGARRWSTPTSGRRTSRGIPTARCSRSPPIPTGATS